MTRSSYKLISQVGRNIIKVSNSVLKLKKYSSLMLQNQKRPPEYLCWTSKLIILPSLVHRRIAIHSGRSFSVFQIKPSMLFSRSGSLVRTKKLGSSIHILKKKKKK